MHLYIYIHSSCVFSRQITSAHHVKPSKYYVFLKGLVTFIFLPPIFSFILYLTQAALLLNITFIYVPANFHSFSVLNLLTSGQQTYTELLRRRMKLFKFQLCSYRKFDANESIIRFNGAEYCCRFFS